jgi:hypothetical protein
LLGAIANNPKLATPAADAYRSVYERLTSMNEMAPNALVIALALDSLLFLKLLKLVDFDPSNIELLRTTLKQRAQQPLKTEPIFSKSA